MIGINFKGDNDFINTFCPIMEHVIANLDFEPTKQQVVEIVNNLSYGFYLAFQNRFEREDEIDIKEYLTISEDEVLMGDEVTEHWKDTGSHNGYFYYICYGQLGVL